MTQALKKIWLDTDPGFDDWLTMLLLGSNPGIEWLGVSIVTGNAPDVTPPTVVRVDADWDLRGERHADTAAPPDLVLDGRIDGWISIEPRAGESRRVSVVAGPGEEAFVGPLTVPGELTPAGAAPSASPDRP